MARRAELERCSTYQLDVSVVRRRREGARARRGARPHRRARAAGDAAPSTPPTARCRRARRNRTFATSGRHGTSSSASPRRLRRRRARRLRRRLQRLRRRRHGHGRRPRHGAPARSDLALRSCVLVQVSAIDPSTGAITDHAPARLTAVAAGRGRHRRAVDADAAPATRRSVTPMAIDSTGLRVQYDVTDAGTLDLRRRLRLRAAAADRRRSTLDNPIGADAALSLPRAAAGDERLSADRDDGQRHRRHAARAGPDARPGHAGQRHPARRRRRHRRRGAAHRRRRTRRGGARRRARQLHAGGARVGRLHAASDSIVGDAGAAPRRQGQGRDLRRRQLRSCRAASPSPAPSSTAPPRRSTSANVVLRAGALPSGPGTTNAGGAFTLLRRAGHATRSRSARPTGPQGTLDNVVVPAGGTSVAIAYTIGARRRRWQRRRRRRHHAGRPARASPSPRTRSPASPTSASAAGAAIHAGGRVARVVTSAATARCRRCSCRPAPTTLIVEPPAPSLDGLTAFTETVDGAASWTLALARPVPLAVTVTRTSDGNGRRRARSSPPSRPSASAPRRPASPTATAPTASSSTRARRSSSSSSRRRRRSSPARGCRCLRANAGSVADRARSRAARHRRRALAERQRAAAGVRVEALCYACGSTTPVASAISDGSGVYRIYLPDPGNVVVDGGVGD